MFDERNVSVLSIPQWEAVYRAELAPGVIALIAIHDMTRGPGLGGCRLATYPNEAEALTDALRLSRGMTFKNAVADLPLGGGKSVLLCDPKLAGEERTRILAEYGKFLAWVNRDQTCYYGAEDMNTTVADMHVVQQHTCHITGIEVDPSPSTAWGVFQAMAHCVETFAGQFFAGDGTLAGKRVLIQGLGKVGMTLLQYLVAAKAQIFVCDVNPQAIERARALAPNLTVIPVGQQLSIPLDVFAPCAGGEVITRENLNQVQFKILCGAANNQLQREELGALLQRKAVVYCPDYIANMGGVCAIQFLEIEKMSDEACREKIGNTVRRRLNQTFAQALMHQLPFNIAVDQVIKQSIWHHESERHHCDNRSLFPDLEKVSVDA